MALSDLKLELSEDAIKHTEILMDRYKIPANGVIIMALVKTALEAKNDEKQEVDLELNFQTGNQVLESMIKIFKEHPLETKGDRHEFYEQLMYAAQFITTEPIPDFEVDLNAVTGVKTGEEFLIDVANSLKSNFPETEAAKNEFLKKLEHAVPFMTSEQILAAPEFGNRRKIIKYQAKKTKKPETYSKEAIDSLVL